MKIALVLNTRMEDDEFQVEYDPPATVDLIRRGILAAGHDYAFIEADEFVAESLRTVKPDLVFNRSEGIRGESRESHIPGILEMLGIPYVGSGPRTLAVCLDKAWTKTFVSAHGVKTPGHRILSTMKDAESCAMEFPFILKPNSEGSSIGINGDNVVHDRSEFMNRIAEMFKTYQQPVLAESFISGREFSVGLLGRQGDEPELFPLLEVDFSRMPASVANVFGQIAKTEYDDLSHYLCPSSPGPELENRLKQAALKVWQVLEIRDFARIDFRVGSDNQPQFLEVNPLPGMDYDTESRDFSFYTLMAFKAGYNYNSLVAALIDSARWRYSL